MFKNVGLFEVLVFLTPFAIYLTLCHVAGKIANKKGQSYLGFFLISLILTPILGLIIALISPNNKEKTNGNN
jgi:uncharacterized membrane protein